MISFDIRKSSTAVWLQTIAAIIAILGLINYKLIKTNLLIFFKQTLNIPYWLIFPIVLILLSIIFYLLKYVQENTKIKLSNEMLIKEREKISKINNDYLKENESLNNIINSSGFEEFKAIKSKLIEKEDRLLKYEKLENEIIGILADGGEYTFSDLSNRLTSSHKNQDERETNMRLAIGSLKKKGKISGVWSKFEIARYKITNNMND